MKNSRYRFFKNLIIYLTFFNNCDNIYCQERMWVYLNAYNVSLAGHKKLSKFVLKATIFVDILFARIYQGKYILVF